MSSDTTIINAITGESITTDLKFFISLNEFKNFILQKWFIDSDQLLLLLPFGHKVNDQTFLDFSRNGDSEHIFYVYDRRLFSIVIDPNQTNKKQKEFDDDLESQVSDLLKIITKDQNLFDHPVKPITSPLVDANLQIHSLTSHNITSLLTTNIGWLSALEIDVHYFRVLIQDTLSHINHIIECLKICKNYLELYCYDVEDLYNSNVKFLDQLASNEIKNKWVQVYENTLCELSGLEGPLSQYLDKKRLDELDSKLKELDPRINNKLKMIKVKIDKNSDYRSLMIDSIESLRIKYTPDIAKYSLEETMLAKFSEIAEELRGTSHNILEKDQEVFDDDYIKIVRETLTKYKSKSVPNLFTIAQALYSQSEDILSIKSTLQKEAVKFLGQVSFLQMEILNIKKNLLNDCSPDLELYQNFELELAHVEDMPLIYGLYIIEKYRRESWIIQVNLQSGSLSGSLSDNINYLINKEQDTRKTWNQNFGSTASIFCQNLNEGSDFKGINSSFNEKLRTVKDTTHKINQSMKNEHQQTLKYIEDYIQQIKKIGVDQDVVNLFNRYLSSAKGFQIESKFTNNLENPQITSKLIRGYKFRIKKLESLLHSSRYSNLENWPSGLLNQPNVKLFRDNVATINDKLSLTSSAYFIKEDDQSDTYKVQELEKTIKDFRQKIKRVTDDNQVTLKKLSTTASELVDIQVERDAYKETLANLNKELSRLTCEESEHKKKLFEKEHVLNKQLNKLVVSNKEVVTELVLLQEKLKTLEDSNIVLKKELEDKNMDIETNKIRYAAELEALNKQSEKESKLFKEQIESMEEKVHSDINQVNIESNNVDLSILNSSKFNELQKKNKDTIEKLFGVFSSNVFILENIGLLLTFDNNDDIQIRRVKGLRKTPNQSILNESTKPKDLDLGVKSTV